MFPFMQHVGEEKLYSDFMLYSTALARREKMNEFTKTLGARSSLQMNKTKNNKQI